ncbi:hypothetical protein [Thermotoga neapolitana]|nr:hypothetical protein [Thermotoga neapolitana]
MVSEDPVTSEALRLGNERGEAMRKLVKIILVLGSLFGALMAVVGTNRLW